MEMIWIRMDMIRVRVIRWRTSGFLVCRYRMTITCNVLDRLLLLNTDLLLLPIERGLHLLDIPVGDHPLLDIENVLLLLVIADALLLLAILAEDLVHAPLTALPFPDTAPALLLLAIVVATNHSTPFLFPEKSTQAQ